MDASRGAEKWKDTLRMLVDHDHLGMSATMNVKRRMHASCEVGKAGRANKQ